MFILLEWFLHQKTTRKFLFTWSKATIMVIKIWDFSDVLPNFPSTTSDSMIVINKHGIYELPHELPKDLRLGN